MRVRVRLSTPPNFFGIFCDDRRAQTFSESPQIGHCLPFSADLACPPGRFRALATRRDFSVSTTEFILWIPANENISYPFSSEFVSDDSLNRLSHIFPIRQEFFSNKDYALVQSKISFPDVSSDTEHYSSGNIPDVYGATPADILYDSCVASENIGYSYFFFFTNLHAEKRFGQRDASFAHYHQRPRGEPTYRPRQPRVQSFQGNTPRVFRQQPQLDEPGGQV